MSNFVLVHGSFTASWSWRNVIPYLRRHGHATVAPDLPAHGDDGTPLDRVALSSYVDAVVRVAKEQTEPPILVGHSVAAEVVAMVAEADPGLPLALVFVAGLVPASGTTAMSVVERFDPAYLAEAVWADDRRAFRISPEGLRRYVCQACPAAAVDEVLERMRMEPIAPYEAPMIFTDKRFGRVRKYYIETLRDKAVPLSMQRDTQQRTGCVRAFSLDTDHCPFFSTPEELAGCLSAIAGDLH